MATRAKTMIELPWTREDTDAAAREGWCVCAVDHDGHAPWEVSRIDDVEMAAEEMGFPVPQLEGDDVAAELFRAAYARGESHALKLYEFLREQAQQEFAHWNMGEWLRA